MADKRPVVDVLEDVFHAFLPNVVGKAIGDALGSIIAFLKMKEEVEKLYNTADVLDGYVITTDEVKKPIIIPTFKVDIFNISITIDNKSEKDLNLFSIFKSTKQEKPSFIKFYKVIIKLGFSKKDILGIEDAGNYSLVYKGGFEYYDDIKFKLTDTLGFSIEKSDKKAMFIEGVKSKKKVKLTGNTQKSLTKAIAEETDSKKAFEVIFTDILIKFFGADNADVSIQSIKKVLTTIFNFFGFKDSKVEGWVNKIIDLIEKNRGKIEEWYETKKDDINGGYLITSPKLKDAIETDPTKSNFYLKMDKHSSDTENKLGLISIFIASAPSKSYIDIPNIIFKLILNHSDVFGSSVTGMTELTHAGRVKYFNNIKFDITGKKGFSIKNTTIKQKIKGNDFEIFIKTLDIKESSISNHFTALTGKLAGSITLSDFNTNTKIENADVTITESPTDATISIKVGDLSFTSGTENSLNIKDATFYLKKYKDGNSERAYIEFTKDIKTVFNEFPEGVKVNNIDALSVFKYSWDTDGYRSLQGTTKVSLSDNADWNILRSYFKLSEIQIFLLYNQSWKKGGFQFDQGELTLSAEVTVELAVLGGISLKLALSRIKDSSEIIFQYSGYVYQPNPIVTDKFKLTINGLSVDGEIKNKKTDKYISLNGKLNGELEFFGIGDSPKKYTLDKATISLKESADEKIITIEIDDFSFQETGDDTLTINNKATFYLKKYKVEGTIIEESYVEITTDTDASKLSATLPNGVESTDIINLNTYLRYSWVNWVNGGNRSLQGTIKLNAVVGNNTLLNSDWDRVIKHFKPESIDIFLDYNNSWNKGGGFKFSNSILAIGASLTTNVVAIRNAEPDLKLELNIKVNKIGNDVKIFYEGKKKNEEPIVIDKVGAFKLTINELFVDGEFKKKRSDKFFTLNGVLDGTIEWKANTLTLVNAKTTIKQSTKENEISVKVDKIEFVKQGLESNMKALLQDASFYFKKDKINSEKEGFLELTFDLTSQNNNSLILPKGIDKSDLSIKSKFKYKWGTAGKSIAGSILFKDESKETIKQEWNYLPDIKDIMVSYEQPLTGSGFDFSKGKIQIGTLFSIQKIIDKLPLGNAIFLRTGNEDGYITASIDANENISINDAVELGIFIDGIDAEEPTILLDIDKINIIKGEKFEVTGTIDIDYFKAFKKGDREGAVEINLDAIPFTLGTEKKDGKDKFFYSINSETKEKGFLSITPGNINGFLKKLLGDQSIEIGRAISIAAEEQGEIEQGEITPTTSSERKFLFKKDLLKNKSIGKFKIDVVTFEIPELKKLVEAGRFEFYVLTDISADFGPFYAKVSGLGAKAWLEKSKTENFEDRKNLSIQLGLKILPPTRAAFEIKAKLVTGGGYLEFDYENHSYAGILALNLKAVEIVAIGLITTRLPNNQPGFSMLICISVIFGTPIQLSFGFNLKGVGGLFGIHRTFKIEPMRERFISGSINSIMFPIDPIKNAEKIIGDLKAIFPPEADHYVFAPFVKIGWSEFLELDIGVLVEFPFKGRLILLGSVGLLLPDKNDPQIEIHIDVLGDFNFAEKYIRIEGVLRNSRIRDIQIYGGFAFYLTWDKNPQFMFSVGGYHPRYNKPLGFPNVGRVGASLSYGENLALNIEFYTAITSNSFQTGFQSGFYAKYDGAEIKGYFGFDVLMYFRPFYFEASIGLSASIKYKNKSLAGASLAFTLTGPKPWVAVGSATIDFKVFKFDIDFNYTWGGTQALEAAPTIAVDKLLGDLKTELEKTSNWAARLPDNFTSFEMLRSIGESEKAIIVHPSGYLEIRQQILPLNRTIEKHGQSTVQSPSKFLIKTITIGENTPPLSITNYNLKEYFSRGQFENLTDEEKISTPDFELMSAGIRLESAIDFIIPDTFQSIASGAYEDIIITAIPSGTGGSGSSTETKTGASGQSKLVTMIGQQPVSEKLTATSLKDATTTRQKSIPRDWQTERLLLNKSRRNQLFKERPEQAFQLEDDDLIFHETSSFVVASQVDLLGQAVEFTTYSDAKDYLKTNGKSDTLQVATTTTVKVSKANSGSSSGSSSTLKK